MHRLHSNSVTCIQYYGAGALRGFSNDMELLPLSFLFRFNDGTVNATTAITVGVVTAMH
ncbi:MAG: hypothetical protein AB9869_31685 [Verrucomicrobiia bacterium]